MFKKFAVLVVIVIGLVSMTYSYETKKAVGDKFGQDLAISEVITANTMFSEAESLNGKIIRVSGTISELCKHKGCWMQVKDGEQVLTVRFKDEAFTLPADAIGRNVDFEGLFIAEKVSDQKGAHTCAEGGEHGDGEACENERAEKHARAADMRYSLISTGLILL